MDSQDVLSLLGELLPRIRNDVSLAHICTKLSWKTFPALRRTSTDWQMAIGSGLVYDIRVRSCSTETLVVITHHKDDGENCIGLYSTKEKALWDLPPIPGFQSALPWSWHVIPLDGKVYALGGPCDDLSLNVAVTRSLYMLDLRAGQTQWKQLANMSEGRRFFGCGVISGKIYVFGGISGEGAPTSSSEMCNPKCNTWSPIKAMIHAQVFNVGVAMGDELLLYGGHGEARSSSFQIYHPATHVWRVLQSPADIENIAMFTHKGNLFCISLRAIHIHDKDTNSWRQKHSMSWDGLWENGVVAVVRAMLVVHANSELVAEVYWSTAGNEFSIKSSIIQSKGFNSENEEILWETVLYSGGFSDGVNPFQPFLGTIHL